MSLLFPFFQWADATAVGIAIRDSKWLFPLIEAVHLVALALLGGAVLLIDMRLLGWGLTNQPVRRLAGAVQRWLTASLVVMLVSGFLLFLAEPMKLYGNLPFQIKIATLCVVIVFTYTVRRRVTYSDRVLTAPRLTTATAVVSVFLWSVVGLMGRGIGFW